MSHGAVSSSLVGSLLLGAVALSAQSSSLAVYDIDSFDGKFWSEEPDPFDDPLTVGSFVKPAYELNAVGAPTGEIVDIAGLVEGDWKAIGSARGHSQPVGALGVSANVFGASGDILNHLVGQATWADTITNQSGAPLAFRFDFEIESGGILAATDYAWLDHHGFAMEAEYSIHILLNGASIWSSDALLKVGELGDWHELTLSGTTLGRTFVEFGFSDATNPEDETLPYDAALESGINGEAGVGYIFDGYADSLDLGTFGDGESFTIAYEMTAAVRGPLMETGALAAFGDPLDLGGQPGMSGSIEGRPPDIPEAGSSLLLGCTVLLWALGRRRR